MKKNNAPVYDMHNPLFDRSR